MLVGKLDDTVQFKITSTGLAGKQCTAKRAFYCPNPVPRGTQEVTGRLYEKSVLFGNGAFYPILEVERQGRKPARIAVKIETIKEVK